MSNNNANTNETTIINANQNINNNNQNDDNESHVTVKENGVVVGDVKWHRRWFSFWRLKRLGRYCNDFITDIRALIQQNKTKTSDKNVTNNNHKITIKNILSDFLGVIIAFFSLLWHGVWKALVCLSVFLLSALVIGGIGFGALYISTVGEVPRLEDYKSVMLPQDATIYDVDGETIGVISSNYREVVPFSGIADTAKTAVVCIEDERFYNHEGIDFYGIARALYTNVRGMTKGEGTGTTQGASTITQQYVRNAYSGVGNEKTLTRKLIEMTLSAELESQMSKDDILNAYLNTVYYGHGCYGIQAASKYYFNKDANNLTVYESALLASVINAPSRYDMETDKGKELITSRASLVLDKMYSLGKLNVTEEELRELKKTDINTLLHITPRERTINNPYYYDYVINELLGLYDKNEIESGGWQIYTTLSIKDGENATNCVKEIEERYANDNATSAIVDINVEDGSIHAFCGGTDYSVSQFNTATMGTPQSGSVLKPFLYATLLEEQGYYTSDKFDCSPVNVAGDNEREHIITPYIRNGNNTIRNGIIQSDNAMAIHAAEKAGMDNVDNTMQRSGFTRHLENNSIAIIGGQTTGFSPLELANGYATLANHGINRKAWCLKSITDYLGNKVYEHEDDSKQAIDREVTNQITEAISHTVEEKPNYYDIPYAKEGHQLAAKTGTTDDKADNWCCGFNTKHAVTTWIGCRDSRNEIHLTQGVTVCNTFSDYMKSAHDNDPKEDFEQPSFKTTIPKHDTMNVDDYANKIKNIQLVPNIKYVDTDEVPQGDIVWVDEEGTLTNRHSNVNIYVSKNKITVPSFIGKTVEEAIQASEGLTLNYNINYVTSGDSTPKISDQSIDAYETVDKGSTILLTINILANNNGSETKQVPFISSDNVLEQLRNSETTLTKENEDLKNENQRLEQENNTLKTEINNYERNNNTNNNTNTNNTNTTNTNNTNTNNTNNQVTVPNLTGKTLNEAKNQLQNLGISVNINGNTGTNATVKNTIPQSGTKIDKDTAITLVTE